MAMNRGTRLERYSKYASSRLFIPRNQPGPTTPHSSL
jgi:hypothetical protein